MPANLIGTQLGDYHITGLFPEQGNMSQLYSAVHVADQREAVVKIVKANASQRAAMVNFVNETRIVSDFRHPNIIPILHLGTLPDTRPYLIMPRGLGSLKGTHGHRLPLNQIVYYLEQIAAGLQAAHEKGLVHRDIKPANCIISPSGSIWVSDFGIITETTTTDYRRRDIIGTAEYMAPEQWQGKPVRTSDIYSLSICLYQWLSGQLPFQGDNYQLMNAHCFVSPVDIRELAPDIPADIAQIVMQGLHKDPKQRFDSVIQLARQFEAVVAAQAPAQPKNPTLQSANTAPKQVPRLASAAVPAPATPPLLQSLVGKRFNVVKKKKGRSEKTLYLVELFEGNVIVTNIGSGVKSEMLKFSIQGSIMEIPWLRVRASDGKVYEFHQKLPNPMTKKMVSKEYFRIDGSSSPWTESNDTTFEWEEIQ